jgi:hypothetical protein
VVNTLSQRPGGGHLNTKEARPREAAQFNRVVSEGPTRLAESRSVCRPSRYNLLHSPTPVRGATASANHVPSAPQTQCAPEPETADRAFVETDNLGPLLHSASGQLFDPGQVVCFVAIAMLKLGDSDSDISHRKVLTVGARDKGFTRINSDKMRCTVRKHLAALSG